MATNLTGLQTKEVLNKVLNSSNDSLQVDIIDATGVTLEVNLDNANDDVLIYGFDGSANQKLKTDSDGHPQIDILSSALPTGASTSANQTTIIGHVDGIEALLTTIDSDTSDIKTAVEVIDNAISGSEMQVDIVADGAGLATSANQLPDGHNVTIDNASGGSAVNIQDGGNVISVDDGGATISIDDGGGDISIDDGGNSITVDGTVTANLSATDNAVLDTIDASLDKMLYGSALAVDVSGGDHSLGDTYEAFYIGVGGDISLDMAVSGANIVFKNVASGQLIPLQATVVNQTGTTATDIVALKA